MSLNKNLNYLIFTLVLSFFVFPTLLYCQQENSIPENAPVAVVEHCSINVPGDVLPVRLKGMNICIGCKLSSTRKAFHQPDKFGHQPVFVVKSAACENNSKLVDIKGWFLHYLLNDHSYKLYSPKQLGKAFLLKGNLYISERVLEVTAFRPLTGKSGKIKKFALEEQDSSVAGTANASTGDATDQTNKNTGTVGEEKPWYFERLQALKDQGQ